MKKYIIKNADGSEQSEMQAIHESRKEAGETLMDYICDHNEDLDVDDDDYLSPFDFALEEVVHHRTGMEQGRWICTRFLGLESRQVVSVVQI